MTWWSFAVFFVGWELGSGLCCWLWSLQFTFEIFLESAWLFPCSFFTHLASCFALWLMAVWFWEFSLDFGSIRAWLWTFWAMSFYFLMGWKCCFCSGQIIVFLCWCLSWVNLRFIFWSFWGVMGLSWPIVVVRFKEKRWYLTWIQRMFRLLLLCCTCLTFGRSGVFFRLRVFFWDWFEAFHEWVNWGLDCNRWGCFLIFEFSIF